MVNLSIETSSSVCSIAVQEGFEKTFPESADMNQRHNEMLPGLVNTAFSKSPYTKRDLDFVAISEGPGSFTGLRVGMSFAKGIAMALKVPLVPVNTLDALALELIYFCRESGIDLKSGQTILVSTIARKGESFCQIYKLQKDEIIQTRTGDTFMGNLDNIIDQSPSDTSIAGPGIDHLINSDSDLLQGERLVHLSGLKPSARSIGIIGEKLLCESSRDFTDFHSFEPMYIKEFTIKSRLS